MKVREFAEVIKKTNKELRIVAVQDGEEKALEMGWRNDGEPWEEFAFVMRNDNYDWSFINVCLAKHIIQYETEMNPVDIFKDETNFFEYDFAVNEVIHKNCERSYAVERIEVSDKVRLYLESKYEGENIPAETEDEK